MFQECSSRGLVLHWATTQLHHCGLPAASPEILLNILVTLYAHLLLFYHSWYLSISLLCLLGRSWEGLFLGPQAGMLSVEGGV